MRRRTPGYRLPAGAVIVSRPSLWGNPWTVDDARARGIPAEDRAAWAVAQYREELEHFGLLSDFGGIVSAARYDAVARDVTERGCTSMAEYAAIALRGHDLACWCKTCPEHCEGLPLGVTCAACAPCHASALLTLSNR